MDEIEINELSLLAKIGCTAEERAFPSMLSLDIELKFNAGKVKKSDNIRDTIDYMSVIEHINQHTAKGCWNTLEKLGAELTNLLLSKFKLLKEVEIKLKKRVSPVASSVAVKICAER